MSVRQLARLGGTPAFAPKVPITRPTLPTYGSISRDLKRVMDSGMITKGEYLRRLESSVEKLAGARCVAVSSCTVGLVLALQALQVDGEVVLPSFTFLASASAPAILRLPLRFVDVGRDAWTIDPAAVESAIGPRTAAVIAVHTFGNPADVDALEAVCRRKRVALIFDAAHGLGALRRGRHVGAGGDAEVFSMSPTKLVAAGEGGLVTTRRDDVATRLDVLREYGNSGDYTTVHPGLNGRLDEMSAILALHGFARLEANAKRRNRLVEVAKEELRSVPGVSFQEIDPSDRSSYKDFSLAIESAEFGASRDELATVLEAEGVDTRRYYSPLVHRHPAFSAAVAEPMPNSEWLESRVLSLPLFSHMPSATMRTIAQLVAVAQRNAVPLWGARQGSSRVA